MFDSIGRLILHLPVFLVFVTVTLAVATQNCSDCSIVTQSGRRLRCIIPSPTEYHCGADTPVSDTTGVPRNLKAKPTTGSDLRGLHPSFDVSWSPPNNSILPNLIGFEISFIPLTRSAIKVCRKLELKDRLQPSDGEVVFTYPPPGCFVENLRSNTKYMIMVNTLPSDRKSHKSISRTTDKSEEIPPYRWNTTIVLQKKTEGEVLVWFAPAPDKFDFTRYEISLDPGAIVVTRDINKGPWNIYTFTDLCQDNYTVYIMPVNTKNAKGKYVCVNLYGEEQSYCMTTFKKFTVIDGDSSCATRSTSPPLKVILSGTFVGVFLVIVVTTVAVKCRKKIGPTPPHAPYLIAGGAYGATGMTHEVYGPAANQGDTVGEENPGFQQATDHPMTPTIQNEGEKIAEPVDDRRDDFRQPREDETHEWSDDNFCSEESEIASEVEEELFNDTGEMDGENEDWVNISIRIS